MHESGGKVSEETIQWRIDDARGGRIAHLTLCRAAKRNALRLADWHAFAETLDKVVDAGAKVLIVRSTEPRVFSAGSDLKELARLADHEEERLPFARAMDAVMRRLSGGPLVTIAEVEGACHGAGVAIAMACDLRVAGLDASFAIPPARFGISYPVGDIARLVRLVGKGQAARLLYSGELIGAGEAARIGLVEMVEPYPVQRIHGLADAIAANSGASLALIRRALDASAGLPETDPAMDAQFLEGFASEDFRAFVAR